MSVRVLEVMDPDGSESGRAWSVELLHVAHRCSAARAAFHPELLILATGFPARVKTNSGCSPRQLRHPYLPGPAEVHDLLFSQARVHLEQRHPRQVTFEFGEQEPLFLE
jgi:hypothetical protein